MTGKFFCTLLLSIFVGFRGNTQDSLKHVSFLTELSGADLDKLLSEGPLLKDLATLKASLRMAITDMSPERVSALRKLSSAQIPVHAWLVVTKEDGFWANVATQKAYHKRYQAFLDWTARETISWKSVCITMMPPREDATALKEAKDSLKGKIALLKLSMARLLDWGGEFEEAVASYEDLVRTMQADGFSVEAHYAPVVLDEFRANTISLQKMLGIVQLNTSTNLAIIHRRLVGDYPNIIAYIDLYAPDAKGIIVGHTAKYRLLDGRENDKILDWQELSRCIIFATKKNIPLHIATLEGCIEQGIISKMKDFVIPTNFSLDIEEEKQRITKMRENTELLLRLLSYPYLLLFWIMLVLVFSVVLGIKLIVRLIR